MPDMPTVTGTAPETSGPSAASASMTRPSLWVGLIVGAAVVYLGFVRVSFSKLG